jgi:uncharacterized repeat protein (TIGR03803 family)
MIGSGCSRVAALAFLLLAAAVFGPGEARALIFTELFAFCREIGCTDRQNPSGGLALDKSGRLYGTTLSGGRNAQNGTAFEVDRGGRGGVIYDFCARPGCADGAHPWGGVVIDGAGHLYGTASAGGTHEKGGVVFELIPNAVRTQWTEKALYSFCAAAACADGSTPLVGVTIGLDGNLYGTTNIGAANNGGVVFQLVFDPARNEWTEHVLYNFCAAPACADGSLPQGPLVEARDGTFYGTTTLGGANNGGAVYALSFKGGRRGWEYRVLHSFCRRAGCADGQTPIGSLHLDELHQALYGVTISGGKSQAGFTCAQGDARGCGLVYSLTANLGRRSWKPKTLHVFCAGNGRNCSSGANPVGGIVAYRGGTLYGVTEAGGSRGAGHGMVYALAPGGAGGRWVETVLYVFCPKIQDNNCSDGFSPSAALTVDASGNLYGETMFGGTGGEGTVFGLAVR